MFSGSERTYYYFVIISLIYLLFRYGRRNLISVFIILLFYDGLFAYLGSMIWNLYKGFMPAFLVISLYLYRPIKFNFKGSGIIKVSFVFFTFSFMLSSFLNDDNITLVLSQYAKYFILFISIFLFYKFSDSFPNVFKFRLRDMLLEILMIQGLLALIKFFFFGVMESIIGSVSYIGGAAGTVLPIMGFIYIWIIRKGALSNRDWLLVLLLLVIGFGSMKRAIWFILPLVMFLLYYFVPGRKITKKLIVAIPIILFVFYLGLRLNPTLNPEKTYWGNFDIKYAFNYAQDYTFGDDEKPEEGTGRGGATFFLFKKIFSFSYIPSDLIGLGLRPIYATDIEEFNATDYGIDHRGSATGIFQTYISSGYLGILATLFFIVSILTLIRDKRLLIVILLFFSWEYFFYAGVFLRTPALSILMLYSILYSNLPERSREVNHIPRKLILSSQ